MVKQFLKYLIFLSAENLVYNFLPQNDASDPNQIIRWLEDIWELGAKIFRLAIFSIISHLVS